MTSATFDVQDLIVNSALESNTVNYIVRFAENSTAMGVLLVFLHIKASVNHSLYVLQDKESASTVNQIVNVSSGVFRAVAYSVSSGDTISSSKPAVSIQSVKVMGNSSKIIL